MEVTYKNSTLRKYAEDEKFSIRKLGGNSEGKRGRKKAWNPDGGRQNHPAGNSAGAFTDI